MRAWLAVLICCGLIGCSSGDPDICTPIADPNVVPEDGKAAATQQELSNQKIRAEACLHREAYRLAGSEKSVEFTAERVMQRCGFLVDSFSAGFAEAHSPPDRIDERFNLVVRPRLLSEARGDFWRFARDKVGEGRAGKCRA